VTSVKQTWVVTKLTFEGIVKLIERVVPIDNIGGPIMIAQMVSQEAKAGIWDLLSLTALISVNLALLNLLPIPVLDGGHLLFYALEIIMRRPLSPRVKEVARKMGLALLITLMMFAVYNDIHRILGQK
jgi:regulator of sigma E protease